MKRKKSMKLLSYLLLVLALFFIFVMACATAAANDDDDSKPSGGGSSISASSDSDSVSSDPGSSGTSSESSVAVSSVPYNPDGIDVVYVTDTGQATYANDTVILPGLISDYEFNVTEVQIGASDLAAQCAAADVVYCAEMPKSDNSGWALLEGFDKPMLFDKVHAYKPDVWDWASDGYDQDATQTNVAVSNVSHPIFTGVTYVNTNEVQMLSAVSNSKGLTYADPSQFKTVTGGTIVSLANVSGSPSAVSILEVPAGTVINGTTVPQKFLQIGINGESYGNVTADGLQIIKNALYYLAGKAVPGAPTGTDGTITVHLTNAGAQESETFIAGTISPAADGTADITGGNADCTLGDGSGYVYTGGYNYQIYTIVDLDGSGGSTANVGDYYYNCDLTVDGNMDLTVDFSDFTLYEASTNADLASLPSYN